MDEEEEERSDQRGGVQVSQGVIHQEQHVSTKAKLPIYDHAHRW